MGAWRHGGRGAWRWIETEKNTRYIDKFLLYSYISSFKPKIKTYEKIITIYRYDLILGSE